MSQSEPTHQRHACDLCPAGKQIVDASDVARVRSNVRRWRDHYFTVWRCPACDSLHSLDRVDLTPYYRNYPYESRTLDPWTRLVFRNYLRRLRRYGLTTTASLLDYGCSRGIFLTFLREHGITRCAGYDAYVPEFHDRRVMEEEYDFVVAQDVIEHVENPTVLLTDLARCVRPGGILCLGTPRADGIDLSDPENYIHSLHQPYHLHIFSERALESLGQECGLSLSRTYRRNYFDTFIPFVNWTFIRSYLKTADNTLDAGFEPPHIGKILTSPSTLVLGLFGYFFPVRSEMMMLFRKVPS